MIIKSFAKDTFGFRPIEVEVVLTSGLPNISILGLPDKIIQESTKRIQTAIVAQGYHMPKAKHVLVNLWPRDERKTSLGIDLAIALGILEESGQKELLQHYRDHFVYGELTLTGEVRAPKDIFAMTDASVKVLTGGPPRPYPFEVSVLENLKGEPQIQAGRRYQSIWKRPKSPYQSYAPEIADLLVLAAVGEHSVLLAGPPGTGKTSFVETLPSLLREPSGEKAADILAMSQYFQSEGTWRPVVTPHHSATALAMCGGGVPPRPGEMVRAHRGVLVLDELLEFNAEVQSMLREPMESHVLTLARSSTRRKFPCDFITLATTNLCRCGEYVPRKYRNCRCSSLQLRSYIQKLSGPLVDRFSVLALTHEWNFDEGASSVSWDAIFERVQRAWKFQSAQKRHDRPNERCRESELIGESENPRELEFLPAFRSRRRRLATLRVARTLADLAESSKIQKTHFLDALCLTLHNFESLRTMEV